MHCNYSAHCNKIKQIQHKLHINFNKRLSADMCPKSQEDMDKMQDKPYAQLVGTLMYLAIATRPDIAKAVGVLSRFTAKPGIAHWKAAQHLLSVTGILSNSLHLLFSSTNPHPFSLFPLENTASWRPTPPLNLSRNTRMPTLYINTSRDTH